MTTLEQLKERLSHTYATNERIDLLNELVWMFWHVNMQETTKWLEESRELAYSTFATYRPHWLGLANNLLNHALIALETNQSETALSPVMDAWTIAIDNNVAELQARCQWLLARYHLAQFNLEQAFELLQESISHAQLLLIEQRTRAQLHLTFAHLYQLFNRTEGAEAHLEQAHHHALMSQDAHVLLDWQWHRCHLLYHQKRWQELATESRQALENAEQVHHRYRQMALRYILVQAHLERADIPTAQQHVSALFAQAKEEDTLQRAQAHHLQATIAEAQGHLLDAEQHLMTALAIVENTTHTPLKIMLYNNLANLCQAQQRFEQAYQHQKTAQTLSTIHTETLQKRRFDEFVIAREEQTVKRDAELYQIKNQMLSQRVEQLTTILQVYDEVGSNLNIDNVLLISLDAALRLSGAEAGYIALQEAQNGLRLAKIIGNYNEEANYIPRDNSLDAIIHARKIQLHNETLFETLPLPSISSARQRIIIPLYSYEQFLGILALETRKVNRFQHEVLQLLEVFRSYIAIALDNAKLYQQVHSQLGEMQKLYEQVSQLETLKTDMLRLASHDLKNPLSIIQGYLQLMETDKNLNESHRGTVYDMLDATHRISVIVNDLMSLDRIEQMANQGIQEIVNLGVLVEDLVNSYRMQAQKKLQTLSFWGNVSDTYVMGDTVQLREAIQNLISNALKYTPHEGNIQVLLQRTPQHTLAFIVEDSGYGIPKEAQERLFQPFYRVKTQETSGIEGTGLGLHLVKNIVQRHGGEMIFSSEYGKGSRFGFEIPLL